VNTALSPKMHRFTPRFQRKRCVSLRVFAENEKFRFFSEYAIYCRKRTVLLRVFANNDKFNTALSPKMRSLTPLFSPKTLKTIQKRTVTKTALSLMSGFRRQCSAMLRAFGENGEL
jgi:hypothetical protein